jgi:sulfate permease, SulP family
MPDGSATAHLYRPKLVNLFLEGYDLATLRVDALAGLLQSYLCGALSVARRCDPGVEPQSRHFEAWFKAFQLPQEDRFGI